MSTTTTLATSANIAIVATKNLRGNPDIYNIENNIGKKTNDDPKSGCKNINNIGIKKTKASFIQNKIVALNEPILLRASIAAIIIQVPIFANSDG